MMKKSNPLITVIEANSATNLILIFSFLEPIDCEESILIWYGGKQKLNEFKKNFKSIKVPNRVIFCTFIKKHSRRFSIIEIYKYKNILKKEFDLKEKSYRLYTCFNSGLGHAILRDNLKCNNDEITLYDDGLAGIFHNRQKKIFIKRLLYFFLNINFVESKHRLFSDKRLKKGISLAPDYLLIGPNKEIKLINSRTKVKKKFIELFENYMIDSFKPNSALFCTHPSIEQGYMSKKDYFNQIKKTLVEIKKNGASEVYYKMHHAEDSNSKKRIYDDLGMIEVKSKNLPAEIFLISPNIKFIVNPYNSVFFISYFLKLLNNKTIICYDLKNHPAFSERKKLFYKLCKNEALDYKSVRFYA